MKMSDMRAKARAIFGPAIAEPMPKQPNGAKALQERANARPIPTYKVGGAVKKAMPPQPTAADREADRKRREEYAKMKVTKEQGEAIARGNRAAAVEGGRYKTGGKVQTSADTAKKLATEMGGMKKGGKPKDGLAVMIAIGSPMKGMKKPVKKAVGGAARSMPMTDTPMRGDVFLPTGKRATAKKPAMDLPVTNVPMRGDVFLPTGGRAPTKAAVNAAKLAAAPVPKPVKRAQGGAGKVRKGMMTPEGQITHAMNKIRGK